MVRILFFQGAYNWFALLKFTGRRAMHPNYPVVSLDLLLKAGEKVLSSLNPFFSLLITDGGQPDGKYIEPDKSIV